VRNFVLRALSLDRVFLAYPLIRNALPKASLADWRNFAGSRLAAERDDKDSGVLAVENESGVIIGLVAYQVRTDIEHGRTLSACNLVAFELLDRHRVAELLVEGLEAEAARLNCRAIHIDLPAVEGQQRPPWLVALLEARGHHVESISLCKRMVSG